MVIKKKRKLPLKNAAVTKKKIVVVKLKIKMKRKRTVVVKQKIRMTKRRIVVVKQRIKNSQRKPPRKKILSNPAPFPKSQSSMAPPLESLNTSQNSWKRLLMLLA